MTSPPPLHPDDRPDFEQALRKALETPEIVAALGSGGTGGAQDLVRRLRDRAHERSAEITAAAADEYAAYRRLRESGGPAAGPPRTPTPPSAPGAKHGPLAAVTVLVPLVTAGASVVFLLLGYCLRLSGSQRELADTLVSAGWIAAACATAAGLAGLIGVLTIAARHRSSPPEGSPPAGPNPQEAPAVARARDVWRQALLQRGMLPFLREQLGHEPASGPSPGDTSDGRRPRLGFSSPDFAGPDFTGPEAPGKE
ncbi:hypothetical protein GTZ78_00515 [Streptomyces sp. SID8361]|uniref:hypothetical protein n=1 Tax=Streptomyces TaxID=1883 RepID=UPI00081E6836|nr:MULTISPECIES: hypothetical protein [unclassified Streptomyces]AUA15153.1 hypothetical protein CFP59_07337 [Streptomyces sp. M56]MYU09219.1 hypothetical protein [Streptomyces sp. SID8361]MYX55602.1 hypothetical protein [Streptomyces sp. SID8382]SCF59818.1 hypothetical protein GA0115260_1001421 [Streptomyces sp. MnatMP-M27]